MEFDGSKEYEMGFQNDGEWQPLVDHTAGGEALVDRGRFQRLNGASHTEGEDLLLRDPDDESVLDVSEIAAEDRPESERIDFETQSDMSRDVVYGSQSGN